MKIAYVLYPAFTALDLVGPYEVISRWPEADVRFLATSLEPVRADRGLTVTPTDTPASLPEADLIVVPGAEDPLAVLDDDALIGWLRGAGVSAGIDMALALTARVHGEELAKALQLGIEYDPQPPFASGSPEKADASTLRLALRMLLGDHPVHSVGRFARHFVRSARSRLTARA